MSHGSTLRFLTAGSERVRIDSSGNVGIGTSFIPQKFSLANNTSIGWVNAAGNNSDQIIYADASSNLNFYTGATYRARIDSSGYLLVGTTTGTGDGITLRPRVSAGSTSQINFNRASTTTVGYPVNFQNGGSDVGYISMSNSAVAYVTSSDYRLKNTITPMTGALEKVTLLKPCTYKWNADGSDGEGFIAHELQEICPNAVVGEKDAVETYTDEDGNEQTRPKYQGIDTSFLVATLTAAIQELNAKVDAQAAEIATLKGAA
jgi:hypothetical protein